MNSVENSFYATSSLSSVIPQLMLQPNCNYMAGKFSLYNSLYWIFHVFTLITFHFRWYITELLPQRYGSCTQNIQLGNFKYFNVIKDVLQHIYINIICWYIILDPVNLHMFNNLKKANFTSPKLEKFLSPESLEFWLALSFIEIYVQLHGPMSGYTYV